MDARLSFGEWLEDAYIQLGMTQSEFADAAGVAQTTVSGWVNGQRPRRRVLPAIAAVLKVDLDELRERAGYVRRPQPLSSADNESFLSALAQDSGVPDPDAAFWLSVRRNVSPERYDALVALARSLMGNGEP